MTKQNYLTILLKNRPDLNTKQFKSFLFKYNKTKVRNIFDLDKKEIDKLTNVWDKVTGKLREKREVIREKINAPTFAYQTLYDEKPKEEIRGKKEHPKYKIYNIPIDKEIPKKSIKELMKIEEIELRSSCQGESEIRPTFLIFRPYNQDFKYVKELVKNINKQNDIKSNFDIGMGGYYRVCVTWKTWAGQDDFKKWWSDLPKKINDAISRTK